MALKASFETAPVGNGLPVAVQERLSVWPAFRVCDLKTFVKAGGSSVMKTKR